MNSSNEDEEAVAPHFKNMPLSMAVTSIEVVPELSVSTVDELIVASYVAAIVGAFGFKK